MPSRSWGRTIPLATASCLARAEASNSTGRVTTWKSRTIENSRTPTRNIPHRAEDEPERHHQITDGGADVGGGHQGRAQPQRLVVHRVLDRVPGLVAGHSDRGDRGHAVDLFGQRQGLRDRL